MAVEEGNLKNLKRSTSIIRAYIRTNRINRIVEFDKIARIYLRELIDMVGCDGCAIILFHEDEANILAEKGFSKKFEELGSNIDIQVMKHARTRKQAFFDGEIQSNPAADHIFRVCSINSVICAPVIAKKDVIGVIYLDSTKKNAFNQEDMAFIDLLSENIATAFDHIFESPQTGDSSLRDGLTGCFDRRQFDADIVAEIAKAYKYQEQLSLLIVDIDLFKKFNESHGYVKGDTLLKKLADVLSANIRAYHRIYRYGGEEFVILMADTNKKNAFLIGRRLRKIIEQERFEDVNKSQPNDKITVSIGIATFPSDACNGGELRRAAELALYKAKESGRNQVCVFTG